MSRQLALMIVMKVSTLGLLSPGQKMDLFSVLSQGGAGEHSPANEERSQ